MTRFFRLAALAAIVSLPLAASAQPDRGARHLDRLTERLDLTESQIAMVRTAMEGERAPGASWDLAARLAPTLSEAQLATLKAQRERGPRGARGQRGQRGEASGERDEQRQERRAEMAEARAKALGLTDAQRQAMESARGERQRSRADVADILTDDQEAVLLVHRALSPRGKRGPRGRRGGRR